MTRKSVWGRANDWLWQTTSSSGVMKDLTDSRWDKLRTPRGLSAVIAFSFLVIFAGPVIAWFVDDGFGIIPMVLVVSIFAALFLLRRAVRLVADAPDGALDERLIPIRNRSYFSAYRALATVMGLIVSVLLWWSIVEIQSGTMAATLSLTWPQVNAVLWFVMSLLLLLPSLNLALAIARRKVQI